MMRALVIAVLLNFAFASQAQHAPIVSQYMINGIAINPAFAGSDDVLSFLVSSRSQWTGLQGAPSTQTISAHGPLTNERMGAGVLLFQDQVGATNTLGVSGNYSYYLPLPYGRLYMGFTGGAFFLRSNISKLKSTEAGDPAIAVDPPLGVLPQFGMGALYRSEKVFVSLSVPLMLTHKLSPESGKFSVKNDFGNYNIFLGGGARVELNEKVDFLPSFLLKSHTSSGSQVDLNALLSFNETIEVGCSVRLRDAILGIIKMHINDQLDATYSYDYTLSALQNYNGGSHEISLRYALRYKTQALGPRALTW